MRRLIIILALLSGEATAKSTARSQDNFKCQEFKEIFTQGYRLALSRCENEEVICYKAYDGGLSCKFKFK